MKPNKLELNSVDGTQLNLEALYQIAPSCFTEVKDDKTGELRHVVNFKTLRQLLGDNAVEDADEMYQFTWPGKQEARREAARPTTKTLRPVVEDSVDWDNTQNLYIEGDNLEVLKLLQKSYMGKVKMIYIDPPYNTGNDFVYDDDFVVTQDDYDLFSGNVDELGNRYRKNTDSNGRFHSDWCSMIYPRLMVARSLLSENGVIFISIDENEIQNMRKITDDIFGEANFVSQLGWQKVYSPKNQARYFSNDYEYVLCYAKCIDSFSINLLPRTKEMNARYKNPDNDPNGPWKLDPMDAPGIRTNLSYGITNPLSGQIYYPASGRHWRFEEKDVIRLMKEGRILFGKTGNAKPAYKRYKYEAMGKGDAITSLWDDVKTTADGTKLLLNIFGESLPKEFIDQIKPKPVEFIDRIINVSTKEDDIIMDYFCGSATTAHAAINRSRTGHKSRYILCDMNNNFNILTKPRIQKVIYSEDWNNGKPVSRKGSNHCFKYMRLEQYEDTLNNLVVKKNTLMDQEGEFFDGYMLGYLFDTETKDSLFSLDWFVNPWNTKLKITRNNETKEEKIDLVETFNYLIGLKVQRISYPKSDICVVEGYSRKEEHILIIWRDCMKVSNEDLNEFFRRMAYSTRDKEFDKIYVNGDNNLENLKTDADTWKVTLIEQEFSKRMFEAE